MAGKPVGSKGRSDKIDKGILNAAKRGAEARNKGDHAVANSTDRVIRHLHVKSGGTTDIPMEGDDG